MRDRASRVDSMSEAEAKSYGDIILPDVADPKEKYLTPLNSDTRWVNVS